MNLHRLFLFLTIIDGIIFSRVSFIYMSDEGGIRLEGLGGANPTSALQLIWPHLLHGMGAFEVAPGRRQRGLGYAHKGL